MCCCHCHSCNTEWVIVACRLLVTETCCCCCHSYNNEWMVVVCHCLVTEMCCCCHSYNTEWMIVACHRLVTETCCCCCRYNNEWMIVDYKRFQPGMQTLPPGVLTVLDQIPYVFFILSHGIFRQSSVYFCVCTHTHKLVHIYPPSSKPCIKHIYKCV